MSGHDEREKLERPMRDNVQPLKKFREPGGIESHADGSEKQNRDDRISKFLSSPVGKDMLKRIEQLAVAETDATASGDTSLVSGATPDPTPPHPEPDRQPPSDGGLLPCPFCGGIAAHFELNEAVFKATWVSHVTHCTKCQARVQSLNSEASIILWNTRANPPTEPVAFVTTDFVTACMAEKDGKKVIPLYATPTPEGDFVLVPREWTWQMSAAFVKANNAGKLLKECWADVIAAAPSPPMGGDREQLAARLFVALHPDQTWLTASLNDTRDAYKQADALLTTRAGAE